MSKYIFLDAEAPERVHYGGSAVAIEPPQVYVAGRTARQRYQHADRGNTGIRTAVVVQRSLCGHDADTNKGVTQWWSFATGMARPRPRTSQYSS
jgi:hypothetical protein